MQNENMGMKMKLTQYEEDVSIKTHELEQLRQKIESLEKVIPEKEEAKELLEDKVAELEKIKDELNESTAAKIQALESELEREREAQHSKVLIL